MRWLVCIQWRDAPAGGEASRSVLQAREMTSRRIRPLVITIPDDITFDDLDLAYDATADAGRLQSHAAHAARRVAEHGRRVWVLAVDRGVIVSRSAERDQRLGCGIDHGMRGRMSFASAP